MAAPARDAIVEAAFRLFLEHGYASTSLSRILAAVPYSKGAVYHHFASKEALLDAVIDRFFTAFIGAETDTDTDAHNDAELTSATTAPDAAELALHLVTTYVDAMDSVASIAPLRGYFAFLASVADRAEGAIAAAQRRSVEQLAKSLGAPNAPTPLEYHRAADVLALIEGAGMLAVMRGEHPDREELTESVQRLLSSFKR